MITFWMYKPESDLPIDTRILPDVGATRTSKRLLPGEVFAVSEERSGAGGTIFLKLRDGEGWLFDQKPDGRRMCVRTHAGIVMRPASMLLSGNSQRTDDDADEELSLRNETLRE